MTDWDKLFHSSEWKALQEKFETLVPIWRNPILNYYQELMKMNPDVPFSGILEKILQALQEKKEEGDLDGQFWVESFTRLIQELFEDDYCTTSFPLTTLKEETSMFVIYLRTGARLVSGLSPGMKRKASAISTSYTTATGSTAHADVSSFKDFLSKRGRLDRDSGQHNTKKKDGKIQQYICSVNRGEQFYTRSMGQQGDYVLKVCVFPKKKLKKLQETQWWTVAKRRMQCVINSQEKETSELLMKLIQLMEDQVENGENVTNEVKSITSWTSSGKTSRHRRSKQVEQSSGSTTDDSE